MSSSPPAPPALHVVDSLAHHETVALVHVTRRHVFLGRHELTVQAHGTMSTRGLADQCKQCGLDAVADHATTHQPSVNFELSAALEADGKRDYAVVGETVREAKR